MLRSAGGTPLVPEAILEPGGHCVHAEPPAAHADARQALREAAKRIERARGAALRKLGLQRREQLVPASSARGVRTAVASVGERALAVQSRPLESPLDLQGLTAAERATVQGVLRGLDDRAIANWCTGSSSAETAGARGATDAGSP